MVKIFPNQNLPKPPIFGPFSDLENFTRKCFTMEMLQSKLCLIIIIAPESCIANRQIGIKVSKFLVVSSPIPIGHVTQHMRNGHFHQYNEA